MLSKNEPNLEIACSNSCNILCWLEIDIFNIEESIFFTTGFTNFENFNFTYVNLII